jgi:metal-responsive CopG/Arc/MetJ family transcriptional regulator
MNDYFIYQSEYIQNNISDIIIHTQLAHQTFEKCIPILILHGPMIDIIFLV